jgi:hypothetical protein
MKLRQLLDGLEPTALERLAANKTGSPDHVRLPVGLLIGELESVLKSYSYVQQALLHRHPPTFSIISLLIEADSLSAPIADFRARVEADVERLCNPPDDAFSRDKNYGLYRRVLAEAWKSNLAIDDSEAAILGVLRRELGITLQEHLLLEHHADLQPFWRSELAFERERNALLAAGILFVNGDHYAIAAEVAPLVRQAWELYVSRAEARRLYEELTIGDLTEGLKQLGLKSSGTKEAKVEQVMAAMVSPREVLLTLSIAESLKPLARRVNCPMTGSKDELVDRILEHFDAGRDLAARAPGQMAAASPPPPPERKELSEQFFRVLFGNLTNEELYEILSELPDLKRTGSKEIRLATLWSSPFSEATLLNRLTNRSLTSILDRCRLKVSGPKDEKIKRLIDDARIVRSAETLPAAPAPVVPAPIETAPQVANAPAATAKEPNGVDEMLKKYAFLDREQAIILCSLRDLQSLTDVELERVVARYDLGWYFLREEMRRLIDLMKERCGPVIERREAGEHEIYVFREVLQ